MMMCTRPAGFYGVTTMKHVLTSTGATRRGNPVHLIQRITRKPAARAIVTVLAAIALGISMGANAQAAGHGGGGGHMGGGFGGGHMGGGLGGGHVGGGFGGGHVGVDSEAATWAALVAVLDFTAPAWAAAFAVNITASADS